MNERILKFEKERQKKNLSRIDSSFSTDKIGDNMLPKGGMTKMIKKAQELQSQMEKAQEELNSIEIEGQAGGGMVSVKVNGHKELITLDIDPEVLQEDKEMIEDLIVAAVNQALQNAGKAAEEKMSSITGGLAGKMKLPGMV